MNKLIGWADIEYIGACKRWRKCDLDNQYYDSYFDYFDVEYIHGINKVIVICENNTKKNYLLSTAKKYHKIKKRG